MTQLEFNPNSYRASNDVANYLSIGCRITNTHPAIDPKSCTHPGIFSITDTNINLFYDFISKHKDDTGKLWCFVERRTPFFMFFSDFDIDKYLPQNIDGNEFCLFLIANIINALKYYIHLSENEHELLYIYSDREDKANFHLYFPNIILSSHHALAIRNKALELLKANNKFGIAEDLYDNIVDDSIYKGAGLKLLFQKKPHEDKYYKINLDKSTYKKIPTSMVDQLKLTSIRNKAIGINFYLNMNIDGVIPLLMEDIDRFKIQQEQPPKILKQIKKNIKPKKRQKNNIIVDDTDNDKENENDCEDTEEDVKKNALLEYDVPWKIIMRLINNLKKERFYDYNTWISLIFLCKNIGLLKLGHKFSKQFPDKYNKEEIDKIYDNDSEYNKKQISISSLFYWSNIDNSDEHKKIIKEYLEIGYYKQLIYENTNKFIFSKSDEVYESQFLKKLSYEKNKTFIIKASLGSNKTGSCIEAIVNIVGKDTSKNISCIASRIILCSDLFNRFNEPVYGETENRPKLLEMEHYNSVIPKNNLINVSRVIQTPDSLIHVIDFFNGEIKVPHIVFIDEIESLFDYVCMSDTLNKKRKDVFSVLIEYIKYSEYLFLVDGGISPYIIDFIKKLRNDPTLKVVYNKLKNDMNKYYFMANEYDWMNKLDVYLKQNKKVYMPTDSKEFSDRMAKYIKDNYKDYTFKLYNVDTKDEDKVKLGNVNDTWREFYVIICSPTILYGVNFSEKEYFDVIFGYYQTTILPGSAYQQLRRVRYVKEEQVFIYLKNPKKYNTNIYPTKIDDLREFVRKNMKEFIEYREALNIVLEKGKYELDKNDLFNNLFLYFLSQKHKANNDYLGEFTRCITEWGGKVFLEIKRGKKNTEYEEKKKETMLELKKENVQLLLIANSVVYKYDEIKYKPLKTKEDKDIILVNRIRNVFNLNKLNEEFLLRLGKSTNIDKFNNSLIYFANDAYKIKFINNRKDKEFENIIANHFKKISLIREYTSFFWEDDLVSTDIQMVICGKKNLDNKQKLFILKNEKDLRLLFTCLKQRVIPTNTYQFIEWLIAIVNDFFGSLLTIDISKRKEKRIKCKRTFYYDVKIICNTYIELIFKRNISIIHEKFIDYIKNKYNDVKCIYKSLHNHENIVDFIEDANLDNENNQYYFIDELNDDDV